MVRALLLTRFHNETWGGEKVFVLLARLQEDPVRYRDILEFIYLCLCLGFEGRYKVMSKGQGSSERIVRQLHKQLAPEAGGEAPSVFTSIWGSRPPAISCASRYPCAACSWAALILALIFGLYHHQLNNQTQDVLRQLGELLK